MVPRPPNPARSVESEPETKALASVDSLQIAQNPATSSDQLARLQRNRARSVRRAVASNPNLHLDNFSTAALAFPEAVLQNPVLDWLLLEDANWMEDLEPQARHRLLYTPTINPTWLWWAARFGESADQLSVLTNPRAPVEIVQWIAEQDRDGNARVAAQHRNLQPTDNALASKSSLRKDSVSGAHEIPVTVSDGSADRKVKNDETALPRTIGQSDFESLELAEELAALELKAISSQNFSSDALLLLSCSLLPDWMQPVLASADVDSRKMLSKHINASPAALQILAFDDEAEIRALVAQRPSLPEETRRLLTLLGQGPGSMVQHRHENRTQDNQTRDNQTRDNQDSRETDACDSQESPERSARVGENNQEEAVNNTKLSDGRSELPFSDQNAKLPLDVSAYLATKFANTEQSLAKRWIAAHPLAPESVLASAAGSEDWHVREAAASNPTITLPIAAVSLLDADKDVRIALALNPSCPAEFFPILRFDSNESVREAAATNPRHDETQQPLLDPKTQKLLNKLSRRTPAMRRLLAQFPGQTVAEQRSFAGDKQWEVRLAYASNPEADPTVLARLVTDPDVDVRKAVAGHQNLSTEGRTVLLGDEQPAVRMALGAHANYALLTQLALDESATVRAVVANHPLASASTLERLGDDTDASIQEFVAQHPNTPLATRLRLAAVDDPVVKRAILKWASEPDRQASETAHQPGTDQAQNQDNHETKDQAKDRADDQARVMAVLLGNSVSDAQTWKRLREGDASLSRAKLHRLAYATDWGTESFVSSNTAPKALSVLATFNDWRLRQAVAKHPQTPEATVSLLSRDTDYDVRSSAAQHPLLRPQDRKRLGSDPHFAVRLAIVQRPDTPCAVIDTMVFDDTDHVREAALTNPRLSPEALALYNGVTSGTFVTQRALTKLAKGNSMVRKIIASHPLCSQKLRAELALDDDWRIREAVATNDVTETTILERLSGDADRDVRAAVAVHPNTPLEKLLILSGDSDHSVRTAVLANPGLAETQRQACLVSAYRRLLISVLPMERIAALLSPLCTARHLNRRATWQSAQWIERFVFAGHPLANESIVHELLNDAHRAVAIRARHSMQHSSPHSVQHSAEYPEQTEAGSPVVARHIKPASSATQ